MGVGRKPEPTSLRVLRLSSRKAQKLVRKQTDTPGDLLDAPSWFTADQKQAWKYAIDNAPKAILRRIDKAVLAGFIVAEDLHRQASIAAQQSELVTMSPKGFAMQNPYLAIINRQMILMVRAASELGFSPTARTRIDNAAPTADELGDWSEEKTG